jgi:hyperosmotically inducible protein
VSEPFAAADGRVSDEATREAALRAIHSLSVVRESRSPVEVSVEDGVVTLRGWVLSDVMRRVVIGAAEATPGARRVIVDQLYDDSNLRLAVGRALAAVPLLSRQSNIYVSCYQGMVTLAGQVSDEEERDVALQAAASVEGVRSVVERLSVRSTA